MVTIGLWHGLVFLPVLLGIAGPKPYSTSIETGEEVAVSLDNGKVDANKKTHYEMNKNSKWYTTDCSLCNKRLYTPHAKYSFICFPQNLPFVRLSYLFIVHDLVHFFSGYRQHVLYGNVIG